MPYIVNNSDGSLTVTVADNTVDTSTYSLALIGRNVSNYGQFFAQNTIRQLENFASTARPNPTQALVGQQWYDKTENIMRVYDGTVWKRSTGIVVGPEGNRPTSDLGAGGASFFNQTLSKLQVHDGTAWRESSYAGEVTNSFAADSLVDSPTLYGSRVRTLFIREAGTQRKHPVIALTYVKSSPLGTPNRGITDVNGQRETIMALWSDVEFIVANPTETPVDGQIVNYHSELVAAGVGIASARAGRPSGQILKGMNTRAEYETTGVATFNQLFVTTAIGSSSERVPEGYFQDLFVENTLSGDVGSFGSDVTAANFISNGDVTASTGTGTFAELDVTGNAQIGGTTVFNGPVVFNDPTPLGAVDANFTGNVTVGNLSVTGNTSVQDIVADGNLVVNGTTTLNDTVTINANVVTGNNLTVGDTITATSVLVDDITVGVALSAPLFSGNVVGTTATFSGNITSTSGNVSANNFIGNVFGNLTGDSVSGITGAFTGNVSANNFNGTFNGNLNGTASQATYADLAEKYVADQNYLAGTVVKLGGEKEITQTTHAQDADVFGVISTDPAYLMNSSIDGLPVAMTGRVPVRVTGDIHKGDRLTSSDVDGHAQSLSADQYDPRIVIGRALEDHAGGEGIIEMVIGIK